MGLIMLPEGRSRESEKLRYIPRMALHPRVVSVKQLPEKMDFKRGQLFFNELESCMNVDRPAIVLDCSNVPQMDNHVLHLLLCCLEGALQRNGDVRLAAVTPESRINLEFAGADRVFRIFDTVEQAVESFQRRSTHAGSRLGAAAEREKESAHAA